MLIRKNLAFCEITNIPSPDISVELCGIRITNTQPSLNIFACYRSPSGRLLSQADWDLIAECTNTTIPSILLGDFNAHNTEWKCYNTDTNDDRLSNSVNKYDLFLHNNLTTTRIGYNNEKNSNIDLLFSTMNIAQLIEVNSANETFGSDHFPLKCQIKIEKEIYKKKTFKIRTLRTNWESFRSRLDAQYEEFLFGEYESLTTSEKYTFLTDKIINAVQENTPKKKEVHPKKYRNPASWWDEECNKVKRLRIAAFKKWQFTKNLEDLIKYKKSVAFAIKVF